MEFVTIPSFQDERWSIDIQNKCYFLCYKVLLCISRGGNRAEQLGPSSCEKEACGWLRLVFGQTQVEQASDERLVGSSRDEQ